MRFKKYIFLFIFLSAATFLSAQSPLGLVKTDDPRDTMTTFMTAMNDYKKGVEANDKRLKARLNDAVRTLDLSGINEALRRQAGIDTAIYLKEIIDRLIAIDYKYIPTLDAGKPQASKDDRVWLDSHSHRWRMKDSEITIVRIETGDRKGEYLFSKDTAERTREWYERIRHLPYKDGIPGEQRGSGYTKPLIEEVIPGWMNDKFAGMAWWQWLGLFAALLFGLVVKVMVHHLMKFMLRIVAKSQSEWDDKIVVALKGPAGYLGATGLWFLSVYILRFEGAALNILTIVLKIYFSILLVWLLYRLAGVLTEYLKDMAARTETTLDDQLVPLLNRTLKIIIVVAGTLFAIQNLGFNVMSLLAGLGIGGLAIAMAAKDTVANFFGSLMILFDRPFQVGDWIVLGAAEGTVEEIGFRSTRIRTFYNSVISVPNMEVANAKIDNMGLREYRRVLATIGVNYDTPPEKLEAFLEGIKNIIRANPVTRKDYFHVVLNKYGASSLEIMLYFFFKVPTWNDELVERQNIYLEILRLARELGVEFAFPTQTLHIDTFPEKQPICNEHRIDPDKFKAEALAFGPGGDKSRPGGQGFFVPPHKDRESS